MGRLFRFSIVFYDMTTGLIMRQANSLLIDDALVLDEVLVFVDYPAVPCGHLIVLVWIS